MRLTSSNEEVYKHDVSEEERSNQSSSGRCSIPQRHRVKTPDPFSCSKAIVNFEKHGVLFEEAATVFGDPDGLDWDDVVHSHQEQRFKRLGLSVSNRLLLVV